MNFLRLNAYRFQVVAITLLTSGLALAAFAFAVHWLLLNEKYKTLDIELERVAAESATPLVMDVIRGRIDNRRNRTFEWQAEFERHETEYLVVRHEGSIAFQSRGWAISPIPDEWPALADTDTPLDQFRRNPDLAPPDRRPPPRREDNLRQPPPRRDSGQLPPTASNNTTDPRSFFPDPPPRQTLEFGEPQYKWIDESNDQKWRLLILPAPGHVAILAKSNSQILTDMRQLHQTFLTSIPVALALIALGAWVVANKAIQPVKRLTRAAEGVTAAGLSERLHPEKGANEFSKLIEVYNQMLERLEKSFLQSRRFSADAAHELNTPLTILYGNLDQALQNSPTGSEEQAQLSSLIEEVQRLQNIVDKLLTLSRVDSGRYPIEQKPVDLDHLIRDQFDDARLIAPDLNFEIESDAKAIVVGDPALIRQIIANLTSNAIKYNRRGGNVVASLERIASENSIQLKLKNTGKAIPQAAAELIFDRFYRGDPSRNRDIRGLGLGLSLANEFTRLHNGELTLANNEDDDIVFALKLPC